MARTKKVSKSALRNAAAAEEKVVVVEEPVVTAEEAVVEKKASRKTCKTSVCVEMNGLSVCVSDIQNAVKKAVKASGVEAQELKIYVNAGEQAAYYTVNGEGGENYKVDLKTL